MSLTGEDIRFIRKKFGWTIEQFARVLSVHPVTLNRWELAGKETPKIDGMAHPVLLGLHERFRQSSGEERAINDAAKQTASEVERLLVLGGILLALAALIAFASASKR